MKTNAFFMLLLVCALSGCADLAANFKNHGIFKQTSNSENSGDTLEASKSSVAATEITPNKLPSFFEKFQSAFTQDQTFNASQLSSLEQTTECTSLVTEMDTLDALAQTLGLAAKMQVTNFANEIGQTLQGAGGARNSQLDKNQQTLILGLFARGLVWLPMYVEEKQGQRLQEESQSRVLDRDSTRGKQLYPVVDAMLAKLTAQLPPSLPYSFKEKLFILKEPGKNAKALPGGYIQIEEGAVRDLKDRDRLYFAMAHEIAHLLQRHETKHMQAGILDGITTLYEIKQRIANSQGVEKLTQLAGTAVRGRLRHVKHGVGQELGADSCAVRIMVMAGLSDKQIRTATQQFIAAHPVIKTTETVENSALSGVFELVDNLQATHPTTSERVQNLNNQLSKLAAWRTKAP